MNAEFSLPGQLRSEDTSFPASVSPPLERQRLIQASQEFEAFFVGYMMKNMRSEALQSSFMGDEFAQHTYQDMFDDAVAQNMSKRNSIGISQMLVNWYDKTYGIQSSPKDLDSLQMKEASLLAQRFGPGFSSVSSLYGMRIHPVHQKPLFHHGIDLQAPTGTPVYAIEKGQVVFSGEHPQYGFMVDVLDVNQQIHRYAHLNQLSVQSGAYIERGQRVGGVGQTGITTGPHLHYEVRQQNRSMNPLFFLKNLTSHEHTR